MYHHGPRKTKLYLVLQCGDHSAHSAVQGRHHAAVFLSRIGGNARTERVDVRLRHLLGSVRRGKGQEHEERLVAVAFIDDLHRPLSYQLRLVVALGGGSILNVSRIIYSRHHKSWSCLPNRIGVLSLARRQSDNYKGTIIDSDTAIKLNMTSVHKTLTQRLHSTSRRCTRHWHSDYTQPHVGTWDTDTAITLNLTSVHETLTQSLHSTSRRYIRHWHRDYTQPHVGT